MQQNNDHHGEKTREADDEIGQSSPSGRSLRPGNPQFAQFLSQPGQSQRLARLDRRGLDGGQFTGLKFATHVGDGRFAQGDLIQ